MEFCSFQTINELPFWLSKVVTNYVAFACIEESSLVEEVNRFADLQVGDILETPAQYILLIYYSDLLLIEYTEGGREGWKL